MNSQAENMNIALVHDWLTNVAGAERVLLALGSVYPKSTIFTSVHDPEKTKPFEKFKVKTSILQKLPFAKTRREVLVPLTPFAFEQFDLSKFDLVISSTTMAAKGVITKPDTIHICYCHTPPRYLWEPENDPRASKGKFSGFRKNIAHKMRIWDRLAADRVDYYIANSKYVARRIKKYYDRDSIVIYPPVDVERFKIASKNKIKDYYLFVSRLIPYKRCDLIVEAFNDLSLPLKIIGAGPEKKKLQKKAKNNIEFLGSLSDDEIGKYYSCARAFVFAAEEDFGIVPVEAMASGRPVIAYKAGGALETVIEDKTGVFFSEQTPQCLIETIKKFNPNKFNPAGIRQHALKFSTQRFQHEIKKTVNEMIKKYR